MKPLGKWIDIILRPQSPHRPHRVSGIGPAAIREAADWLVDLLLEEKTSAGIPLYEASVHRSRRSKIWVASYTAAGGGQRWRSTRTTNRGEALRRAELWAAQAREERARLGTPNRRPCIRISDPEPATGIRPLSQAETAQLMGVSVRAVRNIELRAIRKLRAQPALGALWDEYLAGEITESSWPLTTAEIQALFDLAARAELRSFTSSKKWFGGCRTWPPVFNA